MEDQFYDSRQLSINDAYQSSENVSKIDWGGLSFHNGFGHQPLASYKITLKQLNSHWAYIRNIDLINNPIDGFSKLLPVVFLVFWSVFLRIFEVEDHLF